MSDAHMLIANYSALNFVLLSHTHCKYSENVNCILQHAFVFLKIMLLHVWDHRD